MGVHRHAVDHHAHIPLGEAALAPPSHDAPLGARRLGAPQLLALVPQLSRQPCREPLLLIGSQVHGQVLPDQPSVRLQLRLGGPKGLDSRALNERVPVTRAAKLVRPALGAALALGVLDDELTLSRLAARMLRVIANHPIEGRP